MLPALLAELPMRLYSADEIVAPYVYVFYLAFLLAFIFTPIMQVIALHYGVIDRPDRVRKIHSSPVAYLGGVAVFVGWLGGLAISDVCRLHRVDPGWPSDHFGVAHPIIRLGIVGGALLIVMLGLWDDIYKLKPWMKITGQVCAAIFLLADGIGIDCTRPLLEPLGEMVFHWFGYQVPPGGVVPYWAIVATSACIVVALVVGCCNASNLMDGLDGLCGGVTTVIAAGFLFVAVHLATQGGGISGIYANLDAQRVILGLALLGAVLGFIPYNFNPASIFMGDTGSMFLGYACATMIVLLGQTHTKWLLASMVIFALPILDTALALARRWTNRRPIFSADKQHFHHQLVARGFTVKQTVMISYGLSIFFALLGVSMVFVRTRYAIGIYLVVFGSIVVAAFKMGMIHERLAGPVSTLDETPADAFASAPEPESVMEITDRVDSGNEHGLAMPQV